MKPVKLSPDSGATLPVGGKGDVTDAGSKPTRMPADRRTAAWTKLAAGALGLALVAFLGGFAAFVADVSGRRAPADPRADAIVVMTGDNARLDGGVRLLAEGRGGRLLISGVHPSVSRKTLAGVLAAQSRALLGCCIDLDHDAKDTAGNAFFTRRWAEERGYDSLIVVTSDYHMPRTLAELAWTMPGAELIAYPVRENAPAVDALLTHPHTLRLLMSEYVKLIGVRLRMLVAPAGAAHARPAPLQGSAPR